MRRSLSLGAYFLGIALVIGLAAQDEKPRVTAPSANPTVPEEPSLEFEGPLFGGTKIPLDATAEFWDECDLCPGLPSSGTASLEDAEAIWIDQAGQVAVEYQDGLEMILAPDNRKEAEFVDEVQATIDSGDWSGSIVSVRGTRGAGASKTSAYSASLSWIEEASVGLILVSLYGKGGQSLQDLIQTAEQLRYAPEQGTADCMEQGPNSPSFTTQTGTGGDWNSPGNIVSSNNFYATRQLGPLERTSRLLVATGFGFSIPTNATISGILLEIERREESLTNTEIRDLDVRLIKDGDANTLSENKARLTENWSGTDTYVSYGGTNDLWLTTWTPAQINNSGFGLVLAVEVLAPYLGGEKASVDHFRITVSYTYAGTCQ